MRACFAKSLAVGLFVSALAFITKTSGGDGSDLKKGAVVRDQVVAGSTADFMEVRHLVLKGTNEEIGKALATIARQRFGIQADASEDSLRTRAQRRYFQKNYPIMYERMRGVASAYGKDINNDAWNFSSLGFPLHQAGCSVVYYPPASTAEGTGIVSRNYDFSTGTLMGTQPPKGALAATARPYIVELYPEKGYSSLAMYSYDLLGGVLDGINSEGLTVALLADDELLSKFKMEPTGGIATAGLGVLQVPRFLLDTCASVEEAKEALLMTKLYYEFIPCHYLIADRHGKSFVWEHSHAHNREYIVENPGNPLVTTNFSLHRYLEEGKPPTPKKAREVCNRYCALVEGILRAPGKLTIDFIKENHKVADATRPSPLPARPPGRTLWHSLYVPEQRQMQVSFYLRDEPDENHADKARIIRSEYLKFALTSNTSRK